MEITFLCALPNCGRLAIAFEIAENSWRCELHALPTQGRPSHRAAPSFGAREHVPVVEERKAQVEKGLGNLAALVSACDTELNVGLERLSSRKAKTLRAVEARFEEMKAALTVKHTAIRQELVELETHLKRYLTDRENRLLPTAQLLCEDFSITPRFLRFGIADLSDHISAVLSDSWALATEDAHSTLRCLDAAQRNAVIESVLEEAADRAEKGIQEALQDADALIESDTRFDQKKIEVLWKLLELAKKQGEENEKWVSRCWGWRQQPGVCNTAATELAVLLHRHLGKFAEAEQTLRQWTSQADSPLQSLQVRELLEMHFASAQYEEAEALGMRMLENYGRANLQAEYYWTALFYITYSMRLQGKVCHSHATFEVWRSRQLGEESQLAKMLRLLTGGIEAHFRKQEAKKLLLQALRIGVAHFPCSAFTAYSVSRLALISEGDAQEQYYRQAKSIYEVTSPMSIHAANNLYNLGMLLHNYQQRSEAESCYLQAKSIYSATASMSIQAAKNLYNLGVLLRTKERWSEAIDCHHEAKSIYVVAAPRSIDAAVNLSDLGVLLLESAQWNEAGMCFSQATFIYEVAAPMSILQAKNLYNLGVLHDKTQQLSDAEKCYKKAKSIYSAAGPRSIDAANNLNDLGTIYKHTKRLNEAEQCWREARLIYEAEAPTSIAAASNLHNIGLLCFQVRDLVEAEMCFRLAHLTFANAYPTSLRTANNLNHLGVVCEKRQQLSEAEKCYRQAQSIYREIAPKSVQAANNLHNMGLLFLKARQRQQESLECFQQAEQIYAENREEKKLIQVQRVIADLRNQVSRQ